MIQNLKLFWRAIDQITAIVNLVFGLELRLSEGRDDPGRLCEASDLKARHDDSLHRIGGIVRDRLGVSRMITFRRLVKNKQRNICTYKCIKMELYYVQTLFDLVNLLWWYKEKNILIRFCKVSQEMEECFLDPKESFRLQISWYWDKNIGIIHSIIMGTIKNITFQFLLLYFVCETELRSHSHTRNDLNTDFRSKQGCKNHGTMAPVVLRKLSKL